MKYCMYCGAEITNNVEGESICARCVQKLVGTELTDQQKSTQIKPSKPRRAKKSREGYPTLRKCIYCGRIGLEDVCEDCNGG